MTDIIRKATIVIGLETGDVKLEIPDMSPILSARSKELDLIREVDDVISATRKREFELVSRLVDNSQEAREREIGLIDQLASAISGARELEIDLLGRITAAESAARETEAKRVKDITAAAAAKKATVKSLLDDIDSLEDKFDKRFDEFSAGLKRITEEEKKLVETTTETAGSLVDSMGQASGGVALLARSFVLLSSSGEEDLQVLLEKLALVQGTIDLFKGSSQIIKGTAAAMSVMRTASISLTAAMGPIGATFTALAVAGGALALMYRGSTKDIDDNTDALARNKEAVDDGGKSAEEKLAFIIRQAAGVDEREFQETEVADKLANLPHQIYFQRKHSKSLRSSKKKLEASGFTSDDLDEKEKSMELDLLKAMGSFRNTSVVKEKGLIAARDRAADKLQSELELDAKQSGDIGMNINTPGEIRASEELSRLTKELEIFSKMYRETLERGQGQVHELRAEYESAQNGAIAQ